ncbi:MAG: response regulator [Lachnospiraceae bacterium]|nr:response regulator [Lachnospiraceae bacterium]
MNNNNYGGDNGTNVNLSRIMNVHLVMVVVSTIGGLGIAVEGALLHWEFWMLPLMVIGILWLWVCYVLQLYTLKTRELIYVIYIMVAFLFHGVHETSFFDVALVANLMMVTVSGADNRKYLDYGLIEYVIIFFIQIYLAVKGDGLSTDSLSISRIILHIFTVFIIYNLCKNSVIQRSHSIKRIADFQNDAKRANESMEDFLSNISHEFRTPINVVTGMSSLLMKENEDDKVIAIKRAGDRLAEQVSDILDYNEIIGHRLILDKEKYEITSLVNDVIQTMKKMAVDKNIELVVDIHPDVPLVMAGDVVKIRKIFIHLISNAFKFINHGGVYIGISATERYYGVNLNIEIQDTGKGMSREEIAAISDILYQADKGRDRSTGGIGLGLTIVYGFAHAMNGFVRIESEVGKGTSVKVSIPQEVLDHRPCLSVDQSDEKKIVTYIKTEKYKIPEVRDYYQRMIESLSRKMRIPVYPVTSFKDLKKVIDKIEITHLFLGQEEYEENEKYFDELSRSVTVVVNIREDYSVKRDTNVLPVVRPLYGLSIVNILNSKDGIYAKDKREAEEKPLFRGVRALIVDDEVMNLIVASGLFGDYEMITDTAQSGKEAINKCNENKYDVVFMDHMMPEMDGVEAMKRIKELVKNRSEDVVIIALTANAVSGAREMFIKEGFDGFIAKPIEIVEFERVMKRVLPPSRIIYKEENNDRNY